MMFAAEVQGAGNSFTAALANEAAQISAEIASPLAEVVTTTDFQNSEFSFSFTPDITAGISSDVDMGVMPQAARFLDEAGPSVDDVIREMIAA
jgi:hypothetical protein